MDFLKLLCLSDRIQASKRERERERERERGGGNEKCLNSEQITSQRILQIHK